MRTRIARQGRAGCASCFSPKACVFRPVLLINYEYNPAWPARTSKRQGNMMAGPMAASCTVRSASLCPERVSVRRSLLSFMACAIVALTSLISGCKSNQAPVGNVTLTLSPLNASVALGSTQQFTVTTSGSTDTSVYWDVNGNLGGDSGNSACGCGTISQSGLYTPPPIIPIPNTVSISVLAHANTNDITTTTVTLVSNVSVAVSPTSTDLVLGQNQTQQFKATVSGTSDRKSVV